MSEEAKGGASAGASNGLGKTLMTVVVTALICAGAGFGAYKFVLLPRLQEEAAKAAHEGDENNIPPESVPMDLPEAQSAVAVSDPSEKASMLVYTVSIVCNNHETQLLVEKNKQWFIAMLADLHRNKTKKELESKETQEAILKQAREEGNSLLRRLQEKPNEEIKIFQMLYVKYSVFQMP